MQPTALILSTIMLVTSAVQADDNQPAPPAAKVVSLAVQPSGLTLEHARDLRRVVVLGATETGTTVDLTPVAKFSPDEAGVVRLTAD